MSNIENFINTAKKDIALIKTIQKTKFSEVYECRLDGKDAVLKIKTDCTFENKIGIEEIIVDQLHNCLLYTSPSPRDKRQSRMPSSA